MTQIKTLWRAILNTLAGWQIVPVVLVAPILIFPDRFPIRWVVPALLSLPALWLLHKLARGRFVTPTPADVPLLILLATLPVGLWASAEPELSVPHLIKVVLGVALFYALVNSLDDGRKLALAGWGLVLGTALLALTSLLGTKWAGGKLPALSVLTGLLDRIPGVVRDVWYSAGFHPNIVGGVLAIFVPVTAAYLLGPRGYRPGWARLALRWLALGVLLAAETLVLVLTQSRGGMLAFGVALVVVAIGKDRRWAWALLALVVAAAVGVYLYGVQPAVELVMGGVAGNAVTSAEGRLELFSRGLYILQDFSFTGIGPGMFQKVVPVLYPLFLIAPDNTPQHVHNIYLQMGIDHGFPGLIAFLALILLLLVIGVQAIRASRGRPWEPLAVGLLAGLLAYLTHGLLDAIDYGSRGHFFVWVLFGLLGALHTGVWRWSEAGRAERGE